MLVQLWPYINDMVVKILKEQVEPEIQKNVPGFLSSIHFEEISLGEVVSQTHSLYKFLNPKTLKVMHNVTLVNMYIVEWEACRKSRTKCGKISMLCVVPCHSF